MTIADEALNLHLPVECEAFVNALQDEMERLLKGIRDENPKAQRQSVFVAALAVLVLQTNCQVLDALNAMSASEGLDVALARAIFAHIVDTASKRALALDAEERG